MRGLSHTTSGTAGSGWRDSDVFQGRITGMSLSLINFFNLSCVHFYFGVRIFGQISHEKQTPNLCGGSLAEYNSNI